MFIRKTPHENYQIVENYYEGRRRMQRVVFNLGRFSHPEPLLRKLESDLKRETGRGKKSLAKKKRLNDLKTKIETLKNAVDRLKLIEILPETIRLMRG